MLTEKIKSQYRGVGNIFSEYFFTYGGFRSFFSSPYLHAAFVVTFLSCPAWNGKGETVWHELTLSILPDVLGFTLGGYAILLAFGDNKFLKLIAGRSEKEKVKTGRSIPSPYMKLNATFVHFVLVQIVAILFAVIGESIDINSGFFPFIGMLLLNYSLFVAVAAVFSIFRFARWFDEYSSGSEE